MGLFHDIKRAIGRHKKPTGLKSSSNDSRVKNKIRLSEEKYEKHKRIKNLISKLKSYNELSEDKIKTIVTEFTKIDFPKDALLRSKILDLIMDSLSKVKDEGFKKIVFLNLIKKLKDNDVYSVSTLSLRFWKILDEGGKKLILNTILGIEIKENAPEHSLYVFVLTLKKFLKNISTDYDLKKNPDFFHFKRLLKLKIYDMESRLDEINSWYE